MTRRYEAELVAVSIAYSPAHAETAGDREESADAAHRYLQETFGEVADRAERAGVDVEHEIIEGETPARALLDYAHEHGFDLIVMRTPPQPPCRAAAASRSNPAASRRRDDSGARRQRRGTMSDLAEAGRHSPPASIPVSTEAGRHSPPASIPVSASSLSKRLTRS